MSKQRLADIIATLNAGLVDRFEELALEHRRTTHGDDLAASVGRAHGGDLDLYGCLSTWPREKIQVAVRLLLPAVSHAATMTLPEAEEYLRFADSLPIAYRYQASQLISSHLAAAPELGAGVGNALLRGDLRGEGATRVWAIAFASAAPVPAANFVLDLLARDEGASLNAVLLQHLPVANGDVTALLEPLQAALSASLASLLPSDDAWYALTTVACFSSNAMELLQAAVAGGDVGAIKAACELLHRAAALIGVTRVPLAEFVRPLLRQAIDTQEVRRVVDGAVASLWYSNSFRESVRPCLGELDSFDEDLALAFPDLIAALCDASADFWVLITRLLLAPTLSPTAVQSLISRCVLDAVEVGLDEDLFASATSTAKVVLARRLLALTLDGTTLCRFIAWLAETPSAQPDGIALAAPMLEQALREYPRATEDFLQARTRTNARTKAFSQVYRGTYASALRWRRVLARLPRLAEIRPTDAQMQALRALRQRVGRDIMRQANSQSIFALISTKLNIAQGRRFVTHTERGLSGIVEMQELGRSFELPSSELSDPMGGLLRRAVALRSESP